MSALALGFVIAVGLMAATVIYGDALDDLGLEFALDQEPQDSLNLVATVPTRLNPTEAGEAFAALESAFEAGPGQYTSGAVRGLRTGTFYLTPAGAGVNLGDSGRPRSYLQSRAGLADHVTVDGRLPSPSLADGLLEAAIGAPSAERLGVAVGDRFDLYPFWDESAAPIAVVVVGIVTRVDDEAGYWTAAGEAFDHGSLSWDTYPFFADEGAIVDIVGRDLVNLPGDVSIVGRVDRGTLSAGTAQDARASFEGFDAFIADQFTNARFESTLPETIASYQDRLTFSRIPLTVIVLQIVGIALYYLVMVASMLVERQAGEIALLKSRGGTTSQVMRVYLLEGLALSVVALILAPPLALGVVASLGRTPIFSGLTGGSALSANLSPEAYLVAMAGAAFALGALLIPAFLATRRTIVHYKQSSGRHDPTPVFFKYYLDLFFVGLLGLLVIRLQQEGALASQDLVGGLDVDPLVLVSPALFLLTAGVLFLRVFPLILRGLSALLARTRLTSLVVAMWHLVRNPTHYGRLVLMLVLATSLGTFAAGFGSTLNQNYGDRAAYEAGADARATQLRPVVPDAAQVYETAAESPGVIAAAAVLRESADYRVDIFHGLDIEVLGVDERIADVAFFRSDFADESLQAIAAALNNPPWEPRVGPAIAAQDNAISAWVKVETSPAPAFVLYAQVRDVTGRVRDVVLDPVGQQLPAGPGQQRPLPIVGDWREYAGRLPASLTAPFTLQGMTFSRPQNLGSDAGSFLVDDLRSFRHEGPGPFPGGAGESLVTSFEDAAGWRVLTGQVRERLADAIEPAADAHEGASALRFSWSERLSANIQRGFTLAADPGVLPAYASDSFFEASGIEVGDVVTLSSNGAYVQVELAGSIAYFPTIADPGRDLFFLVPLARFIDAVNGRPGTIDGVGPSELWFATDRRSFDVDALLSRLPEDTGGITLASDVAAVTEDDPLTAAGWQGVLAMAFGAVLLLSAIGFVVYSYLSAQAQRLEFAILRTLGLTRRQVAFIVTAEQALVVTVGMVVGSLVGLRLGPQVIGYLGITDTGGEVVPPYRAVTDWFTIAMTYATLLAVFAGATGLIAALYTRLAIHRVLRLGEL